MKHAATHTATSTSVRMVIGAGKSPFFTSAAPSLGAAAAPPLPLLLIAVPLLVQCRPSSARRCRDASTAPRRRTPLDGAGADAEETAAESCERIAVEALDLQSG